MTLVYCVLICCGHVFWSSGTLSEDEINLEVTEVYSRKEQYHRTLEIDDFNL